MLVIACNTASAAVLHDARERYDVPVVEVIRPAVRRAAAATRTGRVGVISTLGTHQSGAYLDAFAAAPHLEVVSTPCPRFVEYVERGVTSGRELVGVAHEYLDPMRERDVDTLVLGCTHYPLLTAVISYVMGDGVTLVSSAEETAKDVYRVLADADLLRPDDLPAPGPRLHDHGRPGGVPSPRRPLPRGGLSARPGVHLASRRGERGDRMRLTVIGCSGSFAGPASPASCYLVQAERDGRTWNVLLDLGKRRAGSRCSGTSRPTTSTRSSSATCTPTTAWTSAGSTSGVVTDPAGRVGRRLPVHAPSGTPKSG